MSDLFFTPKRLRKKTSTAGLGSSKDDNSSRNSGDYSFHDSDTQPLFHDVDATLSDIDSSTKLSSWKKLRQRVRIVRRGSVLHRNSERGDHLRRLFLKRRIAEAIIDSMTFEAAEEAVASVFREEQHEQLEKQRRSDSVIWLHDDTKDESYELAIPEDSALEVMQKFDETFIKELKAEVELEMDVETESAKIQEIKNIGREYQECLKGYNEFPLEVRLKNVTYTVPVDEDKLKIMTVYTASCLYPAAQSLRRLYLRERKTKRAVREKVVLSNVSLVLKPGKQYLLLGPPGSGKTTLLRSIAGLVQPSSKKGERVEGSISYNGRTLQVRWRRWRGEAWPLAKFVCRKRTRWYRSMETKFHDAHARGLHFFARRNRTSFSSKTPLRTLISSTSMPHV